MSKPSSSHVTASLFTVLSLVTLVFGVGCMSLSAIKIVTASVQLADIHSGSASGPTALSAVDPNGLTADETDPMKTDASSNAPDAGESLYPVYPVAGDTIGSLSIPVLKLELPILQGTDADELDKGVGHFIESVLPGEADNCVFSGHRTTVFKKLGELVIGDQLTVKTSAGTFTYEVSGTQIVDKDDKTVIVPVDHAVLTLTTCYPFVFIGSAPDRYIVSATLVPDS